MQKFKCEGDSHTTFFELTEQGPSGGISRGLLELGVHYSNRLSYQEVEDLLERFTGQRVLSDQRVWHAVVEKAVAVSQTIADEARQSLEATGDKPLIVASEVDIYAPEQPEILVFEDGIQVKRQKSERVSPEAAPPGRSPTVYTQVNLILKASAS